MVGRGRRNLANLVKIIDKDSTNIVSPFYKLINVCRGTPLRKLLNYRRRCTQLQEKVFIFVSSHAKGSTVSLIS